MSFGGSRIQPRPLYNLTRSSSEESDDFKKKPEQRKCTDVFFIFLFTIFLLGLGILVGYCIYYGDINKIINGYDDCANVCGQKNKPEADKRFQCKGKDMTNNSFLLVHRAGDKNYDPSKIKKECVNSCDKYDGYRTFLTRCVPEKSEKVVNTFFSKTGIKNFFREVSEDLHVCWREIVYLCLIALGFSILIMILMRYLVGAMVWTVLIGVVIACVAGSAYLWFLYFQSKESMDKLADDAISDVDTRRNGSYLTFAIIATILTFLVLTVILVMRKRIQLVIQLFKEAGKAVAAMPLLLLEPILTFVALGIAAGFWIYFSIWIESSGFLTVRALNNYKYVKNGVIVATRWYNLFAALWMFQFIIGCQHMIIAGAVSSWFFTKIRRNLQNPIGKSAYNLIRYHLGSVAFGSFIIATVQLLRVILKFIETNLKKYDNSYVKGILTCCKCCLMCFEKVLKYINRNAYIEIALYGYPFCRAGQQAFKLLASNALRVAAINSVGDFVLFLGKVLVVMATILVGIELVHKKEGLQHMWVPLTLAGVFAYLISHCFITVYEMAIDTIFICFCEDCEQNDGLSRPYFMSKDLMEFVQNSKKALDYANGHKVEAWRDESPASISATMT